MWLGRCWVCHVGDTATNMTLALWMWNNTWQAELLISNHLLSWYASDSVVQLFLYYTVFILWVITTSNAIDWRKVTAASDAFVQELSNWVRFCIFARFFSICALLEHISNNSSSTHVYNLSGAWQVCTFSSSRISFPWREHISGTCRTSRDGRLLMWYQIILFLIVPRGWCSC